MATRIDQYTAVCLPGELPSLTEKPGRPQSTGSQSQTQAKWPCMHRHETFFACGSSAPVRVEGEGGPALGLRGPWRRQVCRDTDCLRRRSHGPIFWASCSWQSEGLLGQSFSIALPVQALRGPSLLLGCIRHLKGHPGWGPTLEFRASVTEKHAGCYPTVVQRVGRLLGHPLCCSAADAGM